MCWNYNWMYTEFLKVDPELDEYLVIQSLSLLESSLEIKPLLGFLEGKELYDLFEDEYQFFSNLVKNESESRYFFGPWKKSDDWKLPKDKWILVYNAADKLKIPHRFLEFEIYSLSTSYVGVPGGSADYIQIHADIISDQTDPCPLKSIEAILTHEFYGHRANIAMWLEQGHYVPEPGTWTDESSASYYAYMRTKDWMEKSILNELLDDTVYKIHSGESEIKLSKHDENYNYIKDEENLEKAAFLILVLKEKERLIK